MDANCPEGWWCLKCLTSLSLVTVFFIPTKGIIVFSNFARIASIFFLILQLMILIDFALDHQEYFQGFLRESRGQIKTFPACINLLIGGGMVLGGLAAASCLYIFMGDCALNRAFTTVTTVLGLVVILLALSTTFDQGLIPPGTLLAYAIFITWQALRSNPDIRCNPHSSADESKPLLALNLAVTCFSLSYTSWSTAKSGINLIRPPDAGGLGNGQLHGESNVLDAKKARAVFHGIFSIPINIFLSCRPTS
jgi:hypothetical protein